MKQSILKKRQSNLLPIMYHSQYIAHKNNDYTFKIQENMSHNLEESSQQRIPR